MSIIRIPLIAMASGPLGISNPAKVNDVSLPDKINGVSGLAGGGSPTLLLGTEGPLGGNGQASGSYWYAHQFTAASSGTLAELRLYVHDDGSVSSSNVGIAIYADSGDAPTGSALDSAAFAAYDWTTLGDEAVHTFDFDGKDQSLSASTKYWIGVYTGSSSVLYDKDTVGDPIILYCSGTYDTPPAGSSFTNDKTGAQYAWSGWSE